MRHPFWKYLLVTALLAAVALLMPLTTRQLALEYPPQTLRCVIDLKGEPVRGLTVGMNKIILREFADDHGLRLEFITPIQALRRRVSACRSSRRTQTVLSRKGIVLMNPSAWRLSARYITSRSTAPSRRESR